jgi:antitoxin HigA-1
LLIITIKRKKIMSRSAIHPGEILADELQELGVSPTELARQVKVPANRITQIVKGKRGITGDTALRLAHWFGTSPLFWLNLQSAHDLRLAEFEAGKIIQKLPRRVAKAA